MEKVSKKIAEPDWLSAMRKILDCIGEKRNVRVDIGRIPLNDKKTLNLFKKGDTEGVFGFGSPDMQKILKQVKPVNFDDLMALCALYGLEGKFRPAVFGMLPEYISRKTGEKKVDNIHPSLKPILAPTCGMILYQDQVAAILCKMAGYSPEDAEVIRYKLAKKHPDQMTKLEPEFFCRCYERKYSRRVTSRVWDLILPYAGLVGRRDLVSVYAFTAYQFAYLKAHYKSEFCAATIHAK